LVSIENILQPLTIFVKGENTLFSIEKEGCAIMFSMDNFGEWLVAELERRDLTQSDLSRMSGLSRGTLSNIVSSTRGRGPSSLLAIAKALKLPPEQVFRTAGLLPPALKSDEETERIVYEMSDLTPQEKEEVLAFINMKRNLRKRK
jgi:transcriptional regulator with XRE-family HTH domain